jgi:hypothetical protein
VRRRRERSGVELTSEGATTAEEGAPASSDDIERVIGNFDDAKLLEIMALRPTILDIEEASMLLSGDADIFGAGRPLKPVARNIVAILTPDEAEE